MLSQMGTAQGSNCCFREARDYVEKEKTEEDCSSRSFRPPSEIQIETICFVLEEKKKGSHPHHNFPSQLLVFKLLKEALWELQIYIPLQPSFFRSFPQLSGVSFSLSLLAMLFSGLCCTPLSLCQSWQLCMKRNTQRRISASTTNKLEGGGKAREPKHAVLDWYEH